MESKEGVMKFEERGMECEKRATYHGESGVECEARVTGYLDRAKCQGVPAMVLLFVTVLPQSGRTVWVCWKFVQS